MPYMGLGQGAVGIPQKRERIGGLRDVGTQRK